MNGRSNANGLNKTIELWNIGKWLIYGQHNIVKSIYWRKNRKQLISNLPTPQFLGQPIILSLTPHWKLLHIQTRLKSTSNFAMAFVISIATCSLVVFLNEFELTTNVIISAALFCNHIQASARLHLSSKL